jgi:multiple sugar transport system substrate-binding protein
MRMRKRFAAGLTAAAFGVAAVGCGNPSDSESGTAEINLIMSNHPWQRAIEPLIPQFEKETGISVQVQTFAEQQARDKIQLNLQSRSEAMDVFMTLPSREGPQFSKAGYYAPLDDHLAKAPEDYQRDDFSRGAFDGMKADGKVIAVPINVEGPVLYYRKDLFAQWNLTPPKTVDDLLKVAAQIKQKSTTISPITLRGVSAAIPFTFGPFFHGTGLTWTDPDGSPNFDKPGAAEAIQQYATLAKDFGPPGVINYSFTESSTLFAQGKAAMSLESSNELNSVIDPKASTVSDKVGVAGVPAGSAKAAPTVLSWGIAVSAYSAKKDDAWRFVQWATSPKIQLELTKKDIAPPRTSVSKDPAYVATLDTPTKKEWSAALAEIQQNGDIEVGPVGEKAPAMRKVIGDAVGKAILGTATPEQAAAEIQKNLAPLLGNG